MECETFCNLTEEFVKEQILQAHDKYNLRNKKLLVIIPDNTRTAPVDMFFKLFYEVFGREAVKLDYLVALGTHPRLTDEEKLKRVGIKRRDKEEMYKNVRIMNHRWDGKETFVNIGAIEEDEMDYLTGGLLRERAEISLNRIIFDYDTAIILGPVFPHEIVGFSGSNKYLFPGICGWNFIDITHWLAALRTNLKTIGIKDTPARRLIDRAAELVTVPIIYFNLVMEGEGLKGLFIGSDSSAWSEAVKLSSRINIRYLSRPLRKVLSIPSIKYDDFWTGAKAFYKIEPVVEDGGEIVVYAPHIKQFSITHGNIIERLGFHIKEYYLNDMRKYSRFPRTVMAHTILVKGTGGMKEGEEMPRIDVVLSTGISKERCDRANIKYKSPDEINIPQWEDREDEGIAVIHNSGEVLYKIK